MSIPILFNLNNKLKICAYLKPKTCIKRLISASDMCLLLKWKIESICGFSSCEQRLSFKNNLLNNNDKKLIEYGISDGCDILCTIYPSKFTVIICVNENESFEILVERNEPLDSLKYKITTWRHGFLLSKSQNKKATIKIE